MSEKISIAAVNELQPGEFIRVIGPVFEQSPWIAAGAEPKRPFTDFENLRAALCQIVENAGAEKQLELIRAHPDLVGRLALAGQLTRESTNEQMSAGLDQLSSEEIALFKKQNAAYQEKFDFPFVICARLNKKDAIMKGFETRLKNSREQEITTALEEIFKIAELRLRDLIEDN